MSIVEIIISVIIVAIMYGFIFIVCKNIVRKINTNSKNYFLKSLQEYNSIILEQAKNLENFQTRIKDANDKKSKDIEDVRKEDNTESKEYSVSDDYNIKRFRIIKYRI